CARCRRRRSRERFEWILDSGELLLGIINDILDLARIDAGKLVMERLPCGLDEVVERVMRQYLELARAKGLHLSVERAPGLPVAFIGDALRLSQILMNLISNAIKFTEKGSVRLEISSQAGVLVFRVVDTGIGMRPDELERIFAAFEQADMSTTRRFGGSGLGLSICKRLAELMGAEIGVESTPGRGSRFELRLPLVEADAPAQCGAAQELTVSTAPRLAGVSILAAEDNELNRLVLEEVLRAEGPRLVCVENGRQLVERVREDGPEAWDIVLMDIQMPEMDGLEATRRVHELAPELQVIALTAHAFSEEGDNCRAAGMADHVSKPFELDALVSAILRHKRRRPPGDAHAPHLHLVRP
ncbi:MAG: response regulator, partial [Zoogloea sp.]|nr:response regulator [Zoogloea sp.]